MKHFRGEYHSVKMGGDWAQLVVIGVGHSSYYTNLETSGIIEILDKL